MALKSRQKKLLQAFKRALERPFLTERIDNTSISFPKPIKENETVISNMENWSEILGLVLNTAENNIEFEKEVDKILIETHKKKKKQIHKKRKIKQLKL